MKRTNHPENDRNSITTIYGVIRRSSKKRIDLTYDYEHTEISVFKRIAEHLEPSRLLDVGANIGVYSIYCSAVSSVKRIDAFEPTPETFAELSRNFELQAGKTYLYAHDIALSDQDGVTKFNVYGNLAGNNSISETDPGRHDRETIEVSTNRLDTILTDANEFFMAKIDVEGHELSVISGAENFLRANRGVVQIESFPQNEGALTDLMLSIGYHKFAKLKHDNYFTNIVDLEFHQSLANIIFDEVSRALKDLQDLRRNRREVIRKARELFDVVRYDSDPLIPQQSPKVQN